LGRTDPGNVVMNATKKRGRPKGSVSSTANKDPEHWFTVGGEVARRVTVEGKRWNVWRIIENVRAEINRDRVGKPMSHRSVERAYGDWCECFPGSAPGAKPGPAIVRASDMFRMRKIQPSVRPRKVKPN
jgi:hypothetical protein